jgi:hypothetical protein
LRVLRRDQVERLVLRSLEELSRNVRSGIERIQIVDEIPKGGIVLALKQIRIASIEGRFIVHGTAP